MDAAEQQKLLRAVVKRLKSVETRMSSFEERMNSLQPRSTAHQGGLMHQIAEELSSVVGLKEALTCQRQGIKYIWTLLFCFGLGATIFYIYSTTEEYIDNPKATNVHLKRPPLFDFPNLVLCSWAWLDVDKAKSKGLTMDAIRYSLAYFDNLVIDDTVSVESARETFLRFYESNNYTSLLDYYKDMATEVVDLTNETMIPFANSNTSSFYCPFCDESAPMEMVPVDQLLCYSFSFTSVDTKHYHGNAMPELWIKLEDNSRHALGVSSNYKIFIMQDDKLLRPAIPPITMRPFQSLTVRTNAQSLFSLRDKEHPCNDSQVVSPYAAEKCLLNCFSELLKNESGCYLFPYSANDHQLHPSQYCNFFDETATWDVVTANETRITESLEGEKCVQRCPYPCNRTISTSTRHSSFDIKSTIHNIGEKAKADNMSLLVITVHNDAMSLGGVLTFTELRTFSWSTFVSNVGGTLGLFVGGTVLTFFQIIMFWVNYLLDKRDKRRSVKPIQANGIACDGGKKP